MTSLLSTTRIDLMELIYLRFNNQIIDKGNMNGKSLVALNKK